MRIALKRILPACALFVAGCSSTIYHLKIPLLEGAGTEAKQADARVVIEDLRPARERVAHVGKDIRACERWFGDDTVVPSKLRFLAMRVSQRTRPDMQIHIRLSRFDIVEYCESVPVGSGTGAAQMNFTPAPNTGDTVVMHLAGDVNDSPFDLESRFDYGTMYRSPNPPSSSPQYREQLRGRLDQFAKEIANIVWSAEIARIKASGN